MEAIYILLAICILLGLAAVVLGALALKRSADKKSANLSVEDIRDENYRLKEAIDNTVRMSHSMLVGAINNQNENSKSLQAQFATFMTSVNAQLDKLKDDIARSLADVRTAMAQSMKEVREDNAKQLDRMRETVDEKLSSTLEQRFNNSFKIVNDRLEEINRTFSELQNLQTGVRDLNNIFKNVKTRGTWGEVALDSLLSQILAPTQYDRQVRITRGSDDAVDFAIKMPGKGDGEVLLPIDAKFPVEDYERLVTASQNADPVAVEAAGKALANRIRQEAMSIRDKYIKPPKTTDFAIMYLPTEGLYAEMIKRDGLIEGLQNQYRIVVCGPTTIAALLNSLQMGFKSVAIEKRSTEIGKLLQSFIVDFGKFSKLLQQTGDKLSAVQSTLANAEKRTEIIQKKLDKVSGFVEDDGLPADDGLLLDSEVASDIDDE